MRSSEAQATRLVVRALSASKLGRLDIPWLKKGRRLCAVRRLSTVQEAGVPSSPIPRSRRSPPPRECQIPAAASFESKRTCQCSAPLLSRESGTSAFRARQECLAAPPCCDQADSPRMPIGHLERGYYESVSGRLGSRGRPLHSPLSSASKARP